MTQLLLVLTACSFLTGGGAEEQADDVVDTAAEARAKKKADKAAEDAKPKEKLKGPLIFPAKPSGPDAPEAKITASQCNDMTDGGPLDKSGCFTATIECDTSIIGHTRGGTQLLDTRWYEKNYCWPATEMKDGGDERLYHFRFPDEGKWRARVTLDSPCADLDVAIFNWDKPNQCPTGKEEGLYECEMKRQKGTKREVVEAVTDGGRLRDWVIAVEGVKDEEGPFSLTVQCVNDVKF